MCRITCLFAFMIAAFTGACRGGNSLPQYSTATGGNAARGKMLISQYHCGACHLIPGVRDAKGMVAPPLIFFGRRTLIAGEVPNSPGNLVAWLRSPQSIESGTAMPTLGLSEQQARDVAAYLYTLR
jgi:cytochrome c